MRRIGQRLFEHWDIIDDRSEREIVARYLSNLIGHIAQIGRGGMLAVLAPDEPCSDELREACSYQIAPLELSQSLVSDYEGAPPPTKNPPSTT